MARGQRSNDAELSRAARNLIIAHGARAAGVAEIRARRLDECGEEEVAETWRQIGLFVRAIEAGKNPGARNKRTSRALVPPADAVPAAPLQVVHPRSVHTQVFHAPAGDKRSRAAAPPRRAHVEMSRAAGMPTPEYKAGDVIRESADLEHWVGTRSNETARLIGSAAPK
jgi:hypothetical protein